MLLENEIAKKILDASFKIHREYGPGLLESVYERLLVHELIKMGLSVRQHVPIQLKLDGLDIGTAFYADLIINDLAIIEIKSVEFMSAVHPKQLRTYLKVSNLRLGLLINFGGALLKDNVVRIVNNLPDEKGYVQKRARPHLRQPK